MLATRPLLAISIAFMAGIALATSSAFPVLLFCACFAVGVVTLVGSRRYAVIGVILAAAAAGAVRYDSASVVAADDISRVPPAAIAIVEGFVATDPTATSNRTSFILRSTSVAAHGTSISTTGDVAVSVLATAVELHDGDHVRLVGTLDRPAGLSNPGLGSWAQYFARRGIRSQLIVSRQSGISALSGGQPNAFRRLAWVTRAALLGSLRGILPRGDAAVLAGVLLGLRADLPPALLAAFVATGTIHILATAGLHVGIVYKSLMWLLETVTVHKKLAALSTIAIIWLYDLMAGGRMAVTRAAIMASIYLLAIVIERTPDALNSLGAAAVAILAFEPTQLLEAGFQTSFGAVLMIATLMPFWEKLWQARVRSISNRSIQRVCRKGVELVGLTLFAQLGAAPVLASAFNVVSVVGSLANLIVVPILFYLIPVGLFVAVLGAWHPTIAAFVAHTFVSPAIAVIVAVVGEFAKLPVASVGAASPPVAVIVVYFAVILGGFVAFEKRLLTFKDTPASVGNIVNGA